MNSRWKRVGSFISTNLSLLQPKMHFAKFGWNCSCGSGEEKKMWKVYDNDNNDDGQRAYYDH